MSKIIIICVSFLFVTIPAFAVPVPQIGAPGGPGEGSYADYQPSLTNPAETDTVITSGNILYVGGIYQNNNVKNLGGGDWSSKGFVSIFNSHGAVLMATVPNRSVGSGSLRVDGQVAFYTTGTYQDGFIVPNPPANRDPIKDQDYLFFDIGSFLKVANSVPNFDSESGSDNEQIKTLTILITGYEWVHFDAPALETSLQGGGKNSTIVTNLQGNSDSLDVTLETVPEPGTLLLLGTGLIGLVLFARKSFKK